MHLKKILLILFIACSLTVSAQVRPGTTRGTMTAEENKRMLGHISDTIYDGKGRMLDSATVKRLLKTYEYGQSMVSYGGITKRIIQKYPSNQATKDAYIVKELQLETPRLWLGTTLELSPLASKINVAKLNNKALVVMIWTRRVHPYFLGNLRKEREDLNEITTKYRDTTKFEVIAITHEKQDASVEEMRNFPIRNALHVIEAPEVTNFYGTKDQPHIIVTDRQHKITYTMKNHHPMTLRQVNSLLKNLK